MKKRYLVTVIAVICSLMLMLTVDNKNSVVATNKEVLKQDTIEDKNNVVEKENTKVKEENNVVEEKIVTQGYGNLENMLQAEADNKQFQGVALVAEGDNILFAKSYGYADRDEKIKNNLLTRFAIASNTKQVTAAAIMQLVDANKISLDKTIESYFPEYKYANKITIRDLIQMRSGIPDYLNEVEAFFRDEEATKIIKEYESTNYPDKYVEDDRWSSELILKNLYQTELYFEPGEMYDYCNTNYYLLGLIIEKVSGLSYEDYLKEKIFKPCEMTTTSLKMKDYDAKGHGSDISGEIAANPNFTYAAGAIYSNIYDVFKWNRMLHKGQVMSKESYNEMITPVDGYGYGVFIEDNTIRHSGVIDGFNSNTQYDRAMDCTIIVLQNADAEVVNVDSKYYIDIIREYVRS